MHTFVDESGIFAPPTRDAPHMCCVTTLSVPDSRVGDLLDFHARLLSDWKPAGGELKGRDLNERNFERIFHHLTAMDVVPTITAVDMMLQSDDNTTAHKLAQAQRLRESVAGDEHLPSMRESVHALAARVEGSSNQLYVQSKVQTEAISRALRVAPMRYAQTEPAALGSFSWRIDAKGRTIQECERLWADLLKPMLQTLFIRKPMLFVTDERFDYSAMDKLQGPDLTTPPAHLVAAVPELANRPFIGSDLRPLVKDLEFMDSKASPGIQFADVIASAFSRACNGRLRRKGWKGLGALMIRHPEDGQAVSYLSLSKLPPSVRPARMPYAAVTHHVEAQARDFVVRRPVT